MLLSREEDKSKEKVLLIGLIRNKNEKWQKVDSLEELSALTKTAGGEVVEKIIQFKKNPDPSTLIGVGKVEEVRRICTDLKINLVIFDILLSPVQRRNLQNKLKRRVIDRRALILDIFALHAKTGEAKVQVELAQLEYNFSQLTGMGDEMSRLGGGIGTRGPGEKKLEIDRRQIKKRISFLKRRLKKIEKQRKTQRKNRGNLFKISLAGYTNAGKSTLLNRLCHSDIVVSQSLFSTLDSFTREFYIKKGIKILITDTVGFIKNLPPELVASFRSTLSVIKKSDMILHIIDIEKENIENTIKTVDHILKELECSLDNTLYVFNKIDKVVSPYMVERIKRKYSSSVFISAKTGEGIQTLKDKIWGIAQKRLKSITLKIPESYSFLIHEYANKIYIKKEGKDTYLLTGYPSPLFSFIKKLPYL